MVNKFVYDPARCEVSSVSNACMETRSPWPRGVKTVLVLVAIAASLYGFAAAARGDLTPAAIPGDAG